MSGLISGVSVRSKFESYIYKKAFLLLILLVNLWGGSLSLAQEKFGQMTDQYIQDVTSERFEGYIQEGMSFFNEHYYLGAVSSWGHALEIDPLNEEVQTLIAGAQERFEGLNRNLEDGSRFLEAGDIARAYEKFVYVQKNSSIKEKALYSLLERGIGEVKKRLHL